MKTTPNAGRNVGSLIVLIGLVAVGVIATSAPVAGQEVTFTKDIAPILQRSCQNCHRPNGGIAPMPLTTYEEVRPWAKAIKQKTALREMPPWFLEKNVGIQKFKDDPSLSDAEIAKVAAWADNGVPQGNPADMPPPRQFAPLGAWNYGTPDLVVTSPVSIVKAVGADWHGEIGSSPTGLTEDRYIKAVEIREFRPDEAGRQGFERVAGKKAGDLNYFSLHHATVRLTQDLTDAATGAAEVDRGATSQLRRDGFSYTFEVGQNALIYPEGVGVGLPAGSDIYFNVHQHSVGRELKMQVQVGLTLHPKGWKPSYKHSVGGTSWGWLTDEIDIPAGQNNTRHEGFYQLPEPGKLMNFEPHMHTTGKRMCLEALYPDGRRETLNCAGYNHNWVKSYIYDEDVAPLLPKGTMMHVIGWFDNTPTNPRNPEPRNWRGYGWRSVDDMFIILSKILPLTEDEFKAEVAAREAKKGLVATTAQNK